MLPLKLAIRAALMPLAAPTRFDDVQTAPNGTRFRPPEPMPRQFRTKPVAGGGQRERDRRAIQALKARGLAHLIQH